MLQKTSVSQQQVSHSIIAYSHGAVEGYRFFSREDFLYMMSDMSLADIKRDFERFKNLEEYEICEKIAFVIEEMRKLDEITLSSIY